MNGKQIPVKMVVPNEFYFTTNNSNYRAIINPFRDGIYNIFLLEANGKEKQVAPAVSYEVKESLEKGYWKLIEKPIKPMETIEPKNDLINHPSHYTTGKVEVIDYIVDKLTKEQFEGYCIGNVLKYVSRYQHKGGYDDLKKAAKYLDILFERNESK